MVHTQVQSLRLNFWRILWSLVAFAVSLLASSTGGRSLWCDEILRIFGQRYTLAELFAFKHLHDFCTQTPTGYLFMRPFQLLFGYETGGNLVSALAAAVIVFCTLGLIRRLSDGRQPGALVSAVVALNPLLLYYGSELAFYEMWAAAFAAAFSLSISLDDAVSARGFWCRAVLFVLAGSLFVTFHFAGLFVWFGFAAAYWFAHGGWKGGRYAVRRGILLAIPAVLNLPMYLGAQGKAIHLGTQEVEWSRLAELPGQLAGYICTLFPSFAGGWLLGVAVFAFGLCSLLRRRDKRRSGVIALASILSVVLFLSYSGLHAYIPQVARYWIFALTPALLVTGVGLVRLTARFPRVGLAAGVALVLADVAAVSVLLQAEGRNHPYRKFQAALPPGAPAVVYVNHYETRFLGGYYQLPDACRPAFPAYWEQGEKCRAAGLVLLHALMPTAPVFTQDSAQFGMAARVGWTTRNVITAREPTAFPLTQLMRLSPEPENASATGVRLIVPTEADISDEAERTGRPAYAPGTGWRYGAVPSRDADKPFVPFLSLVKGETAALRVYVPSTWTGTSVQLRLEACAHGGAADFGGVSAPTGDRFASLYVPLPTVRKGAWNEIRVASSADLAAFTNPTVVAR